MVNSALFTSISLPVPQTQHTWSQYTVVGMTNVRLECTLFFINNTKVTHLLERQ